METSLDVVDVSQNAGVAFVMSLPFSFGLNSRRDDYSLSNFATHK
jgi:hypothetical protein